MVLKLIVAMILRDIDCMTERHRAEKEDERVMKKKRTVATRCVIYICDVYKIYICQN